MAVLVSDSFNRANSTTGLGTTDSFNGGTNTAWQAITGTLGINTNQAYNAGATNDALAVVDAANADVKVSITIATANGIAEDAVYFRVTDANNKWRAIRSSATLFLQKFVSGTKTNVGSTAYSVVNGDVLSVTVSGSSITVTVNGTTKLTATDTFNQTVTKHGFGQGTQSNVSRYDNFQVESLTTGGTGTNVGYSYAMKQLIYADRTVQAPTKQIIYADRSYQNPIKQAIYRDTTGQFTTKQALYSDRVISYALKQIIYADRSWNYATEQDIFSDFILYSANFPLKQIIYADRVSPFATKQQMWVDRAYEFPTLQQIVEKIETWQDLFHPLTNWNDIDDVTTLWNEIIKTKGTFN